MDDKYFDEFLKISQALNSINIVPVLMGSLGLEFVTQKAWNPGDIDIHVEGDPRGWEAPDALRIYNFEKISEAMSQLGYRLIDLHEHEFSNGAISVEFGTINTLPEFAGVELNVLRKVEEAGTQFFVPTLEQYLKIYQASFQDSYRNEQNNNKDLAKIDYLTRILED